MKSSMRFIKSALEYRPLTELLSVPQGVRGIYALYMKRGRFYDMVYIGMSGKGQNGRVRNRLIQHRRKKAAAWTHFSYYEVWDNISDLEIKELEGIFRQLYRFDSRANNLNKQVTHRKLISVRKETEREQGLAPISWRSLGVKAP